jgi:micrococcal nuclease
VRVERLLAIGLLLALAAAVALVAWLGSEQRSPTGGTAEAAPSGDSAVVERVIDGDTIVVELDGRRERVRYVGVDAPELANREAGTVAECWGEEARDANARMLDGAEVRLERDTSDRDRFGRLLRHVWVARSGQWHLVAEELAAAGAVEARSYPPDTRRDDELERAEGAARRAGLGLWGAC